MNKNYLRRLIREYHENGGDEFTLLELTDTPDTYTGQAGKVLTVKETEDGVEFTTISSGTTDHATLTNRDSADQHPISAVTGLQEALDNKPEDFISLSDSPSSYTGAGGKVVAVKATEDGLEFVSAGSGSGDMLASVYDPNNIAANVFDRSNHTGTQPLSTISDAGSAAALDVGTTPGTVAAGDHTHSGMLTTSSSIQDLADVDTMTPTDGQVLTYNGTSNLWEARTVSGGGGSGGWDAEGTFTPVVTRVDGSPHPGIVFLTQVGSYRRLGDVVFFSGEIKWDSCTSENDIRLAGFPYTVNHAGAFTVSKLINVELPYSTGSNNNRLIQGEFVSGISRAFLWCSDGFPATSGTGSTDRGFKFSGFYITTEAV